MLRRSADNVFHHYVTSLKCSSCIDGGGSRKQCTCTHITHVLEQTCFGMRPSARSFEASSVANGTQMTSLYIYFN